MKNRFEKSDLNYATPTQYNCCPRMNNNIKKKQSSILLDCNIVELQYYLPSFPSIPSIHSPNQISCLFFHSFISSNPSIFPSLPPFSHLKLPLYRCRACPRDFFYVTDTTAKNHIRSFHANDLSLLENNYAALSKILHNSRREFFGLSKSEKKAAGE